MLVPIFLARLPSFASQTWANDHLRKATTCLQRPLYCCLVFHVYSIKVPLNNDHLSITTTIFGSRGWPLYTCLTVFEWLMSHSSSPAPVRSQIFNILLVTSIVVDVFKFFDLEWICVIYSHMQANEKRVEISNLTFSVKLLRRRMLNLHLILNKRPNLSYWWICVDFVNAQ